jgi:hypothetical protein
MSPICTAPTTTDQADCPEKGEVNGAGDKPNRHDVLTGSQADGTAFAAGEDRTRGTGRARRKAPPGRVSIVVRDDELRNLEHLTSARPHGASSRLIQTPAATACCIVARTDLCDRGERQHRT